jgi:hypothetical protein
MKHLEYFDKKRTFNLLNSNLSNVGNGILLNFLSLNSNTILRILTFFTLLKLKKFPQNCLRVISFRCRCQITMFYVYFIYLFTLFFRAVKDVIKLIFTLQIFLCTAPYSFFLSCFRFYEKNSFIFCTTILLLPLWIFLLFYFRMDGWMNNVRINISRRMSLALNF